MGGVCVHVSVFVNMYVSVPLCVYVCISLCMCVCTSTRLCVYVCLPIACVHTFLSFTEHFLAVKDKFSYPFILLLL